MFYWASALFGAWARVRRGARGISDLTLHSLGAPSRLLKKSGALANEA